ncbi:MAG: sigma factor [Armatimonadota bacterium]
MQTTNPFEWLDSYSISLIKYKTRKLIGQAGYTWSHIEDIEADLAIHLWQHLPQYDPSKGSIKTFINFVLDNKIRTMVRTRVSARYDVRMHDSSLDESVTSETGETIFRGEAIDAEDYLMSIGSLSRTALELAELRVDIHRIVSQLPQDMQDLCMQLSLENIRNASATTGIPRHKVYELIKRLRYLFDEDGLGEYL